MKALGKRRHSVACPCHEDIRTQTHFFSKLLKKIGRATKKQRDLILSECDSCFIRYLGHCAKGILSSHIRLPQDQYGGLKGSKQFILKLVNPRVSINNKRRHLRSQLGSGFFPLLASIASSVLGSIAGRLIQQK
jgi:hypothetical protein